MSQVLVRSILKARMKGKAKGLCISRLKSGCQLPVGIKGSYRVGLFMPLTLRLLGVKSAKGLIFLAILGHSEIVSILNIL